jgi:hypothetical protein
MTNPNYFYFDGATGEAVEREMTDAEYTEHLATMPQPQETPPE